MLESELGADREEVDGISYFIFANQKVFYNQFGEGTLLAINYKTEG